MVTKTDKQKISKELLQTRFRNATETYNAHAVVQEKMAKELVALASKCIESKDGKMLELGCGTGLLTKEIFKHFSPDSYNANDLVPEVEALIQDIIRSSSKIPFSFIPGDAQEIYIAEQPNIIWSGATIQWILDLDNFFNRIAKSLQYKGYFVFSSFNVDNFKEIREITGCGIDYLPLSDLMIEAGKHFKIKKVDVWKEKLHFENPIEVLKHMRYTGVNGITQNKWSKTNLQDFINKYEEYKEESGYPLTYNPILMIVQKR